MKLKWFLEIVAVIILYGLRIFLLNENLFADYDTAKNFLVIREMAQGDFANLYHHVSPAFFLFYLSIYQLISSASLLIHISAMLNLLAIWWLVHFLAKELGIAYWEKIILLLFVGSSCFLVQNARAFSIESMSLPAFVGIGIYLFKYLQTDQMKHLLIWSGILSFLLVVNYKAFLLLPYLLLVIVLVGKFKLKHTAVAFSIGIAPWLFFPLLNLWLEVDPLQLYKSFYVCAIDKNVNPTVHLSKFEWDIFFYPKYLLTFENYLAFPTAVLFFLVSRKKLIISFIDVEKNKLSTVFLWVFLLFFWMMSVLQKAPRGLLFLYPFIYVLSFLFVQKVIKRKSLFYLVMLLLIALNLFQLNRYVYTFAQSNYQKVADEINRQGKVKVASTVGNGIFPWLSSEVEADVVFYPESMAELKEKGYDYLVVDDYFRNAGITSFESYNSADAVLEVASPSLKSPFLYLEHCEFSGRSYREALAARSADINNGHFKIRVIKVE